jgi:hypothetical protein
MMNGSKFKYNFSSEVLGKVQTSVDKLKSELTSINKDARIVKIEVAACSFTRGLMVKGSDIDNMVVWVQGVSEFKMLSDLNEKFICWLETPGLRIDEPHNTPLILPVENQEYYKKYNMDIPLITVYDGVFRPFAEIASNERASMLIEKNVARIKLFLYAGDIGPEFVLNLLQSEDQNSYFYRDLFSLVEAIKQEHQPLSEYAEKLVRQFDWMYTENLRKYQIPVEEEGKCKAALEELHKKGLLWVWGSRIMIRWRTYGVRWGDSFFAKRISVQNANGEDLLSALSGNMANAPAIADEELISGIYSQDPVHAELAIRQAMKREILNLDEIIRAYIDNLGRQEIFIRAALVEAMQTFIRRDSKLSEICEGKLKDELLAEINSENLMAFYVPTVQNRKMEKVIKICLLIHLIAGIAKSRPERTVPIVEFFYNSVLTKEGIPYKIIQDSLKYAGEIYDKISDEKLKAKIYGKIEGAAKSDVSRTEQIAKEILQRIKEVR